MASAPLEKDIQKICLNWLLHQDRCFAWRQNSIGIYDHIRGFYRTAPKRGVPDIIAVSKGRFIGVEVKRPGGKQSTEQKSFQKALELAGGIYWIVYSLNDLKEKWRTMG